MPRTTSTLSTSQEPHQGRARMTMDIGNATSQTPEFALAVLGLIGANILLDLIIGIYERQHCWSITGAWLWSRVVPRVSGAVIVAMVSHVLPHEWRIMSSAVATTAWIFLLSWLLSRLFRGLRRLGVPAP